MKVSCVMPTGNRQQFVPGAMERFFAQCSPDGSAFDFELELVIVDDGACGFDDERKQADSGALAYVDCSAYLTLPYPWPAHSPLVRYCYVPAPPKLTIGEKRNWGNRVAGGDVIIHWDDDDWSHPNRVYYQVQFLRESKKAVTGYHSILYWRDSDCRGYRYDDPTYRPHAAGTSLCYLKSFWEKNPFEDRQVGEDFMFCDKARRAGELASEHGGQMLVARCHGKNTCEPQFGTKKFPHVSRGLFPSEFLLTLQDRTADTI